MANDAIDGRLESQWWTPIVARLQGLGSRLATVGSVMLLVTFVPAGVLLVRGAAENYREEARTRAGSLLGTLAVPCALTVANHSLDRLDGYLAEVARAGGTHMQLLHIAMLDHQGHVLAQADGGPMLAPDEFDATLASDFARDAAHASEPLWRESNRRNALPVLQVSMPAISGLRWGTLVATFDLAPVERQVWLTSMALGVLALTLAGVIGLSLYIGLSRIVVRPVRKLAEAATAIQRGNLDTRVSLNSRDELGRLSTAFNAMASEIQTQTQDLERKIAERSAEVQRKNLELETLNAELHAANNELGRLTRTDALTGVPNRRHLQTVLDVELQRRGPTSLVMVDVDLFKRLNDSFGHPVGDVVLREVARTLGTGLRASDVLARYGGEEFAIVLPGTQAEVAREVAERMRKAIESHDFAPACRMPVGKVTVSLGVATFPHDAVDGESLLARADQALYAAKNAGRNVSLSWRPEMV